MQQTALVEEESFDKALRLLLKELDKVLKNGRNDEVGGKTKDPIQSCLTRYVGIFAAGKVPLSDHMDAFRKLLDTLPALLTLNSLESWLVAKPYPQVEVEAKAIICLGSIYSKACQAERECYIRLSNIGNKVEAEVTPKDELNRPDRIKVYLCRAFCAVSRNNELSRTLLGLITALDNKISGTSTPSPSLIPGMPQLGSGFGDMLSGLASQLPQLLENFKQPPGSDGVASAPLDLKSMLESLANNEKMMGLAQSVVEKARNVNNADDIKRGIGELASDPMVQELTKNLSSIQVTPQDNRPVTVTTVPSFLE